MELPPERNGERVPEQEPSTVEADEAAYEQSAERRDDFLHTEEEQLPSLPEESTSSTSASASPRTEKDPVVAEVEKILEDGLGPYFSSLPPEAQPVFKKKGEEVAAQLSEMVRTFRFNVRRALQLISDWLKTIPGVNKLFLEQEAKIKTDRILALIEERKKDELP
jgi:hypothetical protein